VTQSPKTISGVVERITYHNEETGYTVAKILPDQRNERGQDGTLSTIIGTLTGIAVGEALELTGYWQHHNQHGWQFSVQTYRSVLPATAQGIRKYLGSGLIKGVGPRTADKIVDHFDTNTLDILDSAPDRLKEVPGIGKKKIDLIAGAWREQKAIKDVMVFLQGHGVSTSLAVRLYKQYADASITIAKNEPYRLAREVNGIGFRTADKIALAMGYKHDDPERLKAGALHALSEATDDGHTYLRADDLAKRAADVLEISLERATQAVQDLILEQGAQSEWLQRQSDGTLKFLPAQAPSKRKGVSETRASYTVSLPSPLPSSLPPPPDANQVVYLWPFYNAEQNIAKQLKRLIGSADAQDCLPEFRQVNAQAMFGYLAIKDGLNLSERQQDGVLMALQHRVSVMTGGPGTGKTTSMRALIRALQAKHKRIVLAAPTGRAAKRLSDATGIEAKTLHRWLQLKPGGKPRYDGDNPIPADMVIVDEASMLDTLLTNTLLKAIATGTHVLFVGDADQLPSVGAGNVLADVIASELVPVMRLDRIFRQSETSAIITNAHRINHGELPQTGGAIEDFFMFAEDDAEKASALVVDLVTRRIPARFGILAADIQVLAPMHNGKCGVAYLNEALQSVLNPPHEHKPQKPFGNRVFRVGDKVLQTRNNYDKDVFNGDAGTVISIDLEDQLLRVRLEDGRIADYEFTELDQLSLAYAISIHKSQGSEYPGVVIPLVMGHYMMLERRLIYTAVTRAKKLAVIVGSRKALAMAVKNSGAAKQGRNTGLAVRLRG
jgi:exodeoxyribonuclease V alpha subunit